MKKIYLAAIAIVLVAVIGSVIFFLAQNRSSGGSGTGTTGTLPVATTSPSSSSSTYVPTPAEGETITLGTPEGSVTMNNFYNGAHVSADHTAILVGEKADAYDITYYAPDSSFSIFITQGPFESVRKEAEAAFLEKLGISEEDACKLKVSVGTSADIDPNYAGQNLGLSFCSTSTVSQ